jgi:hypothetical protein
MGRAIRFLDPLPQMLVPAPQTGVFSDQIRTGMRDRSVLGRRGNLAFPDYQLFRQARNLEGAIPSSRAIWLNGRPLLTSNPTASRSNSSVN